MFTKLSQKFYPQFKGNFAGDFTNNLVGNVMERILAVTEYQLNVTSQSSSGNEFTTATGSITRVSGSFLEENWNIGDTFSASGDLTFTGTITDVQALTILYTLGTGSATPGANNNLLLASTSNYLAAIFKFGLPENSDTTENYYNSVDGSEQVFNINSITSGYQNMNPIAGAKSWITGNCQIKRSAIVSGVCTYTVSQEIIINPYYLDGYQSNIDDVTLPDDFFFGSLSMKYITSLEVRKLMSDPNISNKVIDNETLGSVGFFGENFNGGSNNYTSEIVSYKDTLTNNIVGGVQIDRKTTTIIELTSDGLFNSNTYVGVYLSAILNASQYAANSTYFKTLWNYDNAIYQVDTTNTLLSGIIKSFTSELLNVDTIQITITTEFNVTQQSLLVSGQEFIIASQTADSTLNRDASDNVIMLTEIGSFVKDNDIPGLAVMDSLEFFSHGQSELETPSTNFRGWIEDGIFTALNFGLDISKPGRLERLIFKLIAKHRTNGNEFIIQQYPFDLSSGILVPEGAYQKQVFDLDTTRNFQLLADDIFNRVRLGFIELSSFVYGSQSTVVPLTTIDFGGDYTDTDYIYILTNVYEADLTITALKNNSIELTAAFEDSKFSWAIIKNGYSVTGLRAGRVNLTAGTDRVINFSSLSDDNYTIIPFDVGRIGMEFTDINTTKTQSSFKVKTVPNDGWLNYLIVQNNTLPFSYSEEGLTITAGANVVNFPTFGSTDYTVLLFDVENPTNVLTYTKNIDNVEINSDIDTKINMILILNI